MHFNSNHFKEAGRKLFKALILYCKIDCYEVVHGKKQILEVKSEAGEGEEPDMFNFDDIAKEFDERKDEYILQSDAASSAGSDSEPSEDNMSDAEIFKILPAKPVLKKTKKLISQSTFKKRQRDLEKRLKEKARLKREELEKAKSKPQVKRVHNNYKNILKDRFNLGKIKKVEMVDAWTQTSNPENENTQQPAPKPVPEETTDPTIENVPTMMSRESTNSNFENSKTEDTPISLYKKSDAKFRVRVNSTIRNNKTFRSPISNSEYIKREYNASFSLNQRRILNKNNDMYHSNSIMGSNLEENLDMKPSQDFGYDSRHYTNELKRNKSSRHGSLRNQGGSGYPHTQVRRSPDKYNSHLIDNAKANSMARNKFSIQYSNKGRRKSNQYLPNLHPKGSQNMSKTNSITSSGFSNKSMVEANNMHLRSMSNNKW